MNRLPFATAMIVVALLGNQADAQVQVMKWTTVPKPSTNFPEAIFFEANVDLNKVNAKKVEINIWINGGKFPDGKHTKNLDAKGNFGGDFAITEGNNPALEHAIEIEVVDLDTGKKYKLGGASKASPKEM